MIVDSPNRLNEKQKLFQNSLGTNYSDYVVHHWCTCLVDYFAYLSYVDTVDGKSSAATEIYVYIYMKPHEKWDIVQTVQH